MLGMYAQPTTLVSNYVNFYFALIILKENKFMKKVIFILFLLLTSTSLVHAAAFYANQNGVFQRGTNTPLRSTSISKLCNTYSFTYKGNKYFIVKADKQVYDRTSLLGCEDNSASNIFDPIVSLNQAYPYAKLTSDELKKANVRFVRLLSPLGSLDLNNKSNDFDINNVAYIDLSNMYSNSSNSGVMNLYLNHEKSRYIKPIKIHVMSKTRQYVDDMLK